MHGDKLTSTSFPNGLDGLRSEPEVRAAAYRDLNRSLAGLCNSTLVMASQLMGALEAARGHMPVEAIPILDDLSRRFYRQKESTETLLRQVAA